MQMPTRLLPGEGRADREAIDTGTCSICPSLIHNAHLAIALQSQGILARIFRRRTPLATSIGSVPDRLMFEVAHPDHPRRTFAKLLSGDDLLLDQAPDRCLAHIQDLSCLLERHLPAECALALAIRCNLAVVAQRAVMVGASAHPIFVSGCLGGF